MSHGLLDTPDARLLSVSSWTHVVPMSDMIGTPTSGTVFICNNASAHGVNLERRHTEHIYLWQYESIRVSITIYTDM